MAQIEKFRAQGTAGAGEKDQSERVSYELYLSSEAANLTHAAKASEVI